MKADMTPIDWAKRPLQKYADFSGRAPRSEYWWFVLAVVIGEIAAMIIDSLIGTGGIVGSYGIVVTVFVLAMLIPHIAVAVRRLHDTDRSGWWLLIGLIPLIGTIIIIVFLATEGTAGDNRFGPNPFGVAGGAAFAAE